MDTGRIGCPPHVTRWRLPQTRTYGFASPDIWIWGLAIEIAETFASWDLLPVSDRQRVLSTFVRSVRIERVGRAKAKKHVVYLLRHHLPGFLASCGHVWL